MLKQTTLCLLLRDNQVLLAMKKRGFGVGKWNGYGGKLKDNETLEEAAIREIEEESNISCNLNDLNKVGSLRFYFKKTIEWNQEVNIFVIKTWQGEPTESEEMSPKWFSFDHIPYANMWPDDKYWLPLILQGKKLDGDFYFNDDASGFDKYELKEV